MSARSRSADIVGLCLFLLLCLGVGALAGWVTAESVKSWYPTLRKPSFNPPNAIFGPVWTVLYILMAVAAWRIWRSSKGASARRASFFFALQLALNASWSIVFFGLHGVGEALIVIVLLDVAIFTTWAAFRRLDRLAALLLVPYGLWVAFATVLNAAIWRLN